MPNADHQSATRGIGGWVERPSCRDFTSLTTYATTAVVATDTIIMAAAAGGAMAPPRQLESAVDAQLW